jgi:hypothetical protein
MGAGFSGVFSGDSSASRAAEALLSRLTYPGLTGNGLACNIAAAEDLTSAVCTGAGSSQSRLLFDGNPIEINLAVIATRRISPVLISPYELAIIQICFVSNGSATTGADAQITAAFDTDFQAGRWLAT